jgi:hypothetical protein
MAAAFVQATNGAGESGDSITTAAFGSNTTAGNALLIAIYNDPGSDATTIEDNKGNTGWAFTAAAFSDGATLVRHAYLLNMTTGGAGHTVTVNFGNGVFGGRVVVHEVSGLMTSGAFEDDSGGSAETGTTGLTDTAVAPSTDGQYIFGSAMIDGGTGSNTLAPSNMTEPANSTASTANFEAVAAYLVQPSAGSFTPTWNRSGGSGQVLMRTSTFKAATAVTQDLTPALYSDSDAFFTQTITAGAVDLGASLFSASDAFFTHTVNAEEAPSPIDIIQSNFIYMDE